MTRIKVHYDGWIALPAAVRRKFRLVTGDELELEQTADGIMLRARKPGRPAVAGDGEAAANGEAAAPQAEASAEPAPMLPEGPVEAPAAEKAAAPKRGKRAAAPARVAALPAETQARGRRSARKATAG